MDAEEYLNWLEQNNIMFVHNSNFDKNAKDIQFHKLTFLGTANETSSYESIIAQLSSALSE